MSTSQDRKPGFNVHIEGDFWLDIEEIWPDKDGPENPTRDDVRTLLLDLFGERRWSAPSRLIDDWNLNELGVDVDGLEVWR